MRAWLVRAGLRGEGEQFALQRSVAGIGWPQVGDYAGVVSRDDTLRLLREVFPDDGEKRLGSFATQLWAFVDLIQVGDLVVLPLKTTGEIAIGKVTGGFRHEERNPVDVRQRA